FYQYRNLRASRTPSERPKNFSQMLRINIHNNQIIPAKAAATHLFGRGCKDDFDIVLCQRSSNSLQTLARVADNEDAPIVVGADARRLKKRPVH
ncbi:MAG TPA: hypothetical protein PLQ88_00005, partial [Blastocatellia bacterium]|nr:hypothetical protein [Blastocatellia bacterium]